MVILSRQRWRWSIILNGYSWLLNKRRRCPYKSKLTQLAVLKKKKKKKKKKKMVLKTGPSVLLMTRPAWCVLELASLRSFFADVRLSV